MSEAANQRLCHGFDVDRRKVTTIPHGATLPKNPPAKRPSRPTVLTWGLMGPGKGIERVIEAMGSLNGLPGRPTYLVAGRTHPKVFAADGEAYRDARMEQARRSGVADSVSFDAGYRDVPMLTALVQSCSVVVLPYDSTDQVTSGVLVDAIACGRPVVATAFPHAVELLATGAGVVVDHDDPDALASALRQILTAAVPRRFDGGRGPPTGARNGVAGGRQDISGSGQAADQSTGGLGVTVTAQPPKFDHLLHLTDSRGTFEHACLAEPRPEHGYCTDDVARVLVVATREPDTEGKVNGLAGVALRFLNEAQAYSGACRNRMDNKGHWTDEPSTKDHWGRCIWGLGTAAAHSDVSMVRRLAVIQFERAAQVRSVHPRTMAFAALGAAELLSVDADHVPARKLLTDYAGSIAAPSGDAAWPWPEPRLAYANAVLAEAMIAAGVALEDISLRQRGLDLLGWLVEYETADGHLSPTPVAAEVQKTPGQGSINSRSRCPRSPTHARVLLPSMPLRSGPRACAPARPGSMGDNDAGLLMWDPETGGGFDGLHADEVNRNQGAESTLALISTLQQARRFSTVPQ